MAVDTLIIKKQLHVSQADVTIPILIASNWSFKDYSRLNYQSTQDN